MSLFQHSVLNKYLKEANQAEMKSAYEKLTAYFHNPVIQQNIRECKEEEYQDGFLTALFVNVLGYTIKPNPDYNLTREFKNEKGAKKADGAILKDNAAIGVVELKSTTTKDLEAIRLQAFDYKANQSKCVYVITSNFEKIRFYVNNAVDYEEFDLFKINYEEFQLLWLCLAKENLLKGIPLSIKEDSVIKEENVTKQIYIDYTAFKRDLYNDLIENNLDLEIFRGKEEKEIKLLLFKKSQKLLDRFLFIFFGEDRGLLPTNSITKIIEKWNDDTTWGDNRTLYSIFKQYFNFLNVGRQARGNREEIYAYNGGLFLPDEILDSIKISNEVLNKHTKVLTTYDFETEVDVNILGHIFENSLSEIEEVAAQIEGEEVDLKKSKRKKDGVFYTPKYITKYIVENTVGKLCTEKKTELGIIDFNYDRDFKLKTKREIESIVEVKVRNEIKKVVEKRKTNISVEGTKQLDILTIYRNWLLSLTICDPACGSGAFLNQALDFLIREHNIVTELSQKITGDISTMFIDIENQILENNIFGVDINEESVEIAKLSLWLRTAQKGRKLTTLSNNIKCGNSLIDDPEVAGEKAFNWQNEFPEVFKKGGFDVVIGNPPYVFGGNEGIKNADKDFFKTSYETGSGKINLFTLFIEKSRNILANKGNFSFIIPNTFLRVTSYHCSRKYFIENFQFTELADLGSDVFQDAVTTAIILVATKEVPNYSGTVKIIKDFTGRFTELKLENIVANDFVITTNLTIEKQNLIDKMYLNSSPLGDECQEMIFGVVITKNKDEVVFNNFREGLIPFLEGKDISAYFIKPIHCFIDYQPKLLHRARTPKVFEVPEKLLVQRITGGKRPLKVAYDNRQYYNKESINNIILREDSTFKTKFILTLLNSTLINWLYNNLFTNESTLTVNISKEYLSKIPILIPKNQNSFIEKADTMLMLTEKLNWMLLNLINLLQSKFEFDRPNKKLQNWHELNFKDFLKELEKANVKLTLTEEAEWMQYFNEQKQIAQNLKFEIDKTDRKIDQMVYELYGLTEEEIKIVEESAQ
ncbi:MAG TPA: restriction endonuclease subunit M [Ignavibacteriales bacterium]|nr:restriction endonuclease subunit M [Ignavibacteriales bacterium]